MFILVPCSRNDIIFIPNVDFNSVSMRENELRRRCLQIIAIYSEKSNIFFKLNIEPSFAPKPYFDT